MKGNTIYKDFPRREEAELVAVVVGGFGGRHYHDREGCDDFVQASLAIRLAAEGSDSDEASLS